MRYSEKQIDAIVNEIDAIAVDLGIVISRPLARGFVLDYPDSDIEALAPYAIENSLNDNDSIGCYEFFADFRKINR